MTYAHKIPDADLFRLLRRAQELGVIIAVHPENDGVINLLRSEFTGAGKTGTEYHPLSRPAECEAEAINRMILFARIAGDAPLYIVHLSCALGLEFIETARHPQMASHSTAGRRQGQKNLWAETCPQYLFLDDSLYSLPGGEGLKYVMCPPLRAPADNAALTDALSSGIDVVGTDHCPFFFETQKTRGKGDFTKCPTGVPGIEERIPLMYNLVSQGKISLRRFTDLCCANPAKLFGMYPQKGVIAPGSDADITIIDPEKQAAISAKNLHSNVDYSAYEGFAVKGWPVCTVSRGEVIARGGEFTGGAGRGRFLKRGKFLD
jgi:dihydropyrimidinase